MTISKLNVEHSCSRDRPSGKPDGDCDVFVCSRCRRRVPWCFGADDANHAYNDLCDDCWCDVTRPCNFCATSVQDCAAKRGTVDSAIASPRVAASCCCKKCERIAIDLGLAATHRGLTDDRWTGELPKPGVLRDLALERRAFWEKLLRRKSAR